MGEECRPTGTNGTASYHGNDLGTRKRTHYVSESIGISMRVFVISKMVCVSSNLALTEEEEEEGGGRGDERTRDWTHNLDIFCNSFSLPLGSRNGDYKIYR